MKKRKRLIFVNKNKKAERKAIVETLKRTLGPEAYYAPSTLRI